MNSLIYLFMLEVVYCDWVSDWLTPVQYQYKEISAQNYTNGDPRYKYEELPTDLPNMSDKYKIIEFAPPNEASSTISLKMKLEEVLRTATILTNALKVEIKTVEERERVLKDAIANGRSGITTLIVTTIDRPLRTYFIRNGIWTLCNGVVQYPVGNQPYNVFTELFSVPRCIGQEVSSKRDPCVFNSIIKYEVVPVNRRSFYVEDDYLCLKTTFNNTLQTYMTVPRRVVDETCKNGTVTSLTNNILSCGLRVLSEYSYYPYRNDVSFAVPLEYCAEKDGSCKLLVGWHISNKTIENFEFFNHDPNFKKFFIKTKDYLEPFL
ncbi:uncharacterized protein LOC124533236 [Vanessa cardui]|uniref:uncharacterized protein LOC124533236 n=1 Tax=Vanessa cardui TaxID=171605 RepID=UPI001F145055|nr:uncharacterized protein LOC124533236 [Vanessa cardui]